MERKQSATDSVTRLARGFTLACLWAGVFLADAAQGAEVRLQRWVDEDGLVRSYRAGRVLAHFQGERRPRVVAAAEGSEIKARDELIRRPDVLGAELDVLAERQAMVLNDPRATNQWHHAVIRTTNAWEVASGAREIRVAIVDDPFQMDHPDLAPAVVAGWDLAQGRAITASAGIKHSTLAAGLIAATAGNGVGVAGLTRCRVLPVAASPYSTSTIFDAIIWAADHGARVVSVSWNVAGSAMINLAGEYLRQKNEGILLVAGDNPRRLYSYVNHPDILAVGMTDEGDRSVSGYGEFIDLTAPGWNVYATTIGNSYDADTGSSYATPLIAGVAAHLLAINPSLTSAELAALLLGSCVDLGPPGRDAFYGAGRIDFGQAARKAFATLPVSRIEWAGPNAVAVPRDDRAGLELFRAFRLGAEWERAPNILISANENRVRFEDLDGPFETVFYQVKVALP